MEKEYYKNGKYPNPDYVGKRFGRLVVTGWAGRNRYKNGCSLWFCECDCGEKTTALQDNLRSGDTKSCGCLRKEMMTKHGYTSDQITHPLYDKLRGMKRRCYGKNNKRYKDYGGRGITICDEWLDSPELFVEWGLKHNYKEGLTIERIDNDGNYTPENCCFADYYQQNNNLRSNHLLTYKGKTQSIAKWARDLNIKYSTLCSRILHGWSTERALTTPVQIQKKHNTKRND